MLNKFKLVFLIGFFIFSAQCASTQQSVNFSAPLAIMQSFTTDTETLIIVLMPTDRQYAYRVNKANGIVFSNWTLKSTAVKNQAWKVDHIRVQNISPEEHYNLQIVDQQGIVVDSRSFSALDINSNTVSVGVASCMYDSYMDIANKMLPQFLNENPNMIFLIGDNIYANSSGSIKNPATLWKRHIENRNNLAIFKSITLTPIFSTWDDNDYGKRDGGKEFKFKKASQKAFETFFGKVFKSPVLSAGPGISFSLNAFNQRFIFTDNRSFRTNKKQTKQQSHWGKQQKEWVLRQLNQKEVPTWLIQGDQFFGGYHKFESFEGDHPKDFKKTIKQLSQAKSPIWFISGDRHLFELMKIEKPDMSYQTYELTTSAIHAHVFPSSWGKTPNPRQIAGVANKVNYAVVKAEASKQTLDLGITIKTQNNQELYNQQISITK